MTDGGAVVVNGRFLTQRVTGVQRFAREILAASGGAGLLRPETSWVAVPGEADLPGTFAGLPLRRVGSRQGHPWEQLDLSRQAGDSLLVNLCGTGPVLRRRQLVVMHDAAVSALPRNYTLAFRSWYRLLARAFARFTERICTVSAFSASELQKYFGIPARRIEIIPESGEHILRAEPDYSVHERFALGDGDYFLAVSSHASNKNFRRVVEAAAKVSRSGFKFVIVGGRNAKVFQAVDMDVSQAVEVGYVSDAQLQALYRRAACFVYPSTYEGFGLPPLEAMACGCPVLVSRCAALPETCGDAAAYCDAFDSDDIARQLSRILGSAQARADLSAAGLARSGDWTWRRAGERFSEILAGT